MIDGDLLLVIFITALALLFLLILVFKVNAFIALLVIALGTALAVGIPVSEAPTVVAEGFGNTLASIGIIIGLGVVLGELLSSSGAIQKIAETTMRFAGKKKPPFFYPALPFLLVFPYSLMLYLWFCIKFLALYQK